MASENDSSKMGAPMTEELVFNPENHELASSARLFNRRRQGWQRDGGGKKALNLKNGLHRRRPRRHGARAALSSPPSAPPPRHWGRMTHGTAYVRSRAPPSRPLLPWRWNPFLKVFVGITPPIGSELNQSAREF